MVLLVIKRSDDDQWLYECALDDLNDDVCLVWNARCILVRLVAAVEELAQHGPTRADKLRSTTVVTSESPRELTAVAERDCSDILPGNRRVASPPPPPPSQPGTGEAPPPLVAAMLHDAATGARAALARGHARTGAVLPRAALDEQFRALRASVTVAYPGGLPEGDGVALLLQLIGDGDGTDSSAPAADRPHNAAAAATCPERIDPATAELWWAGASFDRSAAGRVRDRVGRNEKTKIVVRLQRRGGGAPVREPAVSDAERMAMAAWYFKKQEEAKALANDEDDGYLRRGARWADPGALKASLLGTTDVRWGRP